MVFEKMMCVIISKTNLNCSGSTLHIVPDVEIDVADGDIACNCDVIVLYLL